jgi:hypothetical protein
MNLLAAAVFDLGDLLDLISVADLWATIITAAAFITLMFGFVFAWNLVRRLIKGGSKGKLKM